MTFTDFIESLSYKENPSYSMLDDTSKNSYRNKLAASIFNQLSIIFSNSPTFKIDEESEAAQVIHENGLFYEDEFNYILSQSENKDIVKLNKRINELSLERRKIQVIYVYVISLHIHKPTQQGLNKIKWLTERLLVLPIQSLNPHSNKSKIRKKEISFLYEKCPNEKIKKANLQKYLDFYKFSNDDIQSLCESDETFNQLTQTVGEIMNVYDTTIDGLREQAFDCYIEEKKKLMDVDLSETETNFLEFVFKLFPKQNGRFYDQLRANSWEIVPFQQRIDLIDYIKKLTGDETILRRYINLKSEKEIRLRLRDIAFKINDPIVYRIISKQEEIQILLDDYDGKDDVLLKYEKQLDKMLQKLPNKDLQTSLNLYTNQLESILK